MPARCARCRAPNLRRPNLIPLRRGAVRRRPDIIEHMHQTSLHSPGRLRGFGPQLSSLTRLVVGRQTVSETVTCGFQKSERDPWGGGGRYKCKPFLLRNLVINGFGAPTPIQAQAISALLKGAELLAIAPTGSGKTLAFLVPIVVGLKVSPVPYSPHATVVDMNLSISRRCRLPALVGLTDMYE